MDGENVSLPPRNYPTDDFPGLVEARTVGGESLRKQFYMLLSEMDRLEGTNWTKHEHTFDTRQKVQIRARHSEKGGISIGNIYGKDPKALGNRTLASFQINISNFVGSIQPRGENSALRDIYGPFDFFQIIKRLDEEFATEIKESNRQPGFYCLKDQLRVEYRSLPNSVALIKPNTLLSRIEKCVE